MFGLPRIKINVFYVISAICSLLLIIYSWFIFLPSFEGLPEYPQVQTVIILLTVLLVASSGIQLMLSIKKHEPSEEKKI